MPVTSLSPTPLSGTGNGKDELEEVKDMGLKAFGLAATALTAVAVSSPAFAQAAATDEAARIEALEAQIEQLQQAAADLKAQQQTAPAAEPGGPSISWKGAPVIADEEAGWSFKPRGRLMYDFGHVSAPDGY